MIASHVRELVDDFLSDFKFFSEIAELFARMLLKAGNIVECNLIHGGYILVLG